MLSWVEHDLGAYSRCFLKLSRLCQQGRISTCIWRCLLFKRFYFLNMFILHVLLSPYVFLLHYWTLCFIVEKSQFWVHVPTALFCLSPKIWRKNVRNYPILSWGLRSGQKSGRPVNHSLLRPIHLIQTHFLFIHESEMLTFCWLTRLSEKCGLHNYPIIHVKLREFSLREHCILANFCVNMHTRILKILSEGRGSWKLF